MHIPDYNEIVEQNDQVLRLQWEAVLRQVGVEPNDQTIARFDNVLELRKLVGNVYPNKFVRTDVCGKEDTITNLKAYEPIVKIVAKMGTWKKDNEGERPPAEFKDGLNVELKALETVRISGRLTTPPRGNFVHLTDGINKLQIYCNKKGPLALVLNNGNDTLDEANGWAAWQLLDHGDFIGVEGYLFITNTGELSVHVEKLQFLAKAMVPMPDKMHGIADPELQRRYRYADLIASSLQIEHEGLTTRQVFERRAKLITGMRRFLDDAGFIEVETPMLTPKATGAAATPFETHHKALDIPLYARIAPELYLKRLVVGGFEKVYELNRNFRNEGLSQRHNPEFTMLELYIAYMDVNGMMDFAEEMLKESVRKATGGSLKIKYGENEIDFSGFKKLSMKESIKKLLQESFPANNFFSEDKFENSESLYKIMKAIDEAVAMPVANIQAGAYQQDDKINARVRMGVPTPRNIDKLRTVFSLIGDRLSNIVAPEIELQKAKTEEAKIIQYLFELIVEETLIQPTFIVDYPKSISPLSKASPENPEIAERFELFINGMEVANGFSELNDPKEQYDRFVDQVSERERGDEEAMVLDEDYIRALSYGMPPAAGIGIGIDRLVMLLTNKHSIRDVILFPHMRPERQNQEKGAS